MRALLFCLPLIFFASTVSARSHRTDDVPNATNELFNPNGSDCGLCHVRATGGGPRTVIGTAIEVQIEGVSDPAPWDLIFDLDSDRDGYPNGLELGDPMGLFMQGDADPDGPISDPNDPNSNLCGDGFLHDGIEVCDTDADVIALCEEMGYGPGTVTCNQCLLDFSDCEGFIPDNNSNPNNATNNVNNANNLNNANNANNQNTNNANNQNTNNATNNDTTVDGDDDEGGCSTTNGSPSWAFILFALFWVRVGRRRSGQRSAL